MKKHYLRFSVLIPILFFISILCSCSVQKPDNSSASDSQQLNRGNSLNATIFDEIYSEIIPGEELPLSIQYSNSVYTNISFNILSQNDSNGRATVEFTYVDILALADGYMEDFDDIDRFYEYCIQNISSGNIETISETVEVSYTVLVEADVKTYVVDQIEDIMSILTGGAYSVLENILKD